VWKDVRDGLDPSLPFSLWRAWLLGGCDRLCALKHAAGARRELLIVL
jgi:hypothetical protein